mgnify:CR=1 FL=1
MKSCSLNQILFQRSNNINYKEVKEISNCTIGNFLKYKKRTKKKGKNMDVENELKSIEQMIKKNDYETEVLEKFVKNSKKFVFLEIF